MSNLAILSAAVNDHVVASASIDATFPLTLVVLAVSSILVTAAARTLPLLLDTIRRLLNLLFLLALGLAVMLIVGYAVVVEATAHAQPQALAVATVGWV